MQRRRWRREEGERSAHLPLLACARGGALLGWPLGWPRLAKPAGSCTLHLGVALPTNSPRASPRASLTQIQERFVESACHVSTMPRQHNATSAQCT